MDPKQQLSQLDPKLKEAYERVMGTNASPTQSAAPQPGMSPTINTATPIAPQAPKIDPLKPVDMSTSPFPNPSINTTNSTTPSVPNQTPSPTINPVTPSLQAQIQAPTIPTPSVGVPTPQIGATTGPVKVQFNAQTTQPVQAPGVIAQKQKKKGGVSPVLIVLAGIVFIIAYVIFWMKIFNFPIPFLGK